MTLVSTYTSELDILQEVKNSVSLLADVGSEGFGGIHNKWDVYYKLIGCDMTYLQPSSEEFRIIQQYVKNGQPTTSYSKRTVKNVFKLNRYEGNPICDQPSCLLMTEVKNQQLFNAHRFQVNSQGQPKIMLLWHGSALSNFMGILSQGLRIAPPEAPSTGYMFGKAIIAFNSILTA